jgi:hypothetical protein
MKFTESDYIQAGFDYERGRKTGDSIRAMLESEHITDKPEARRLIEQGRAEARKN